MNTAAAARPFEVSGRTANDDPASPGHATPCPPAAAADLLAALLSRVGVPDAEVDPRYLGGAVEALRHLTNGYRLRPSDVIGDALFDDASDEPVVVRGIPYVSICREHVLPFKGTAHVAYLPGDAVVGLSKLARLVDLFAHRLQTPWQLADDVAAAVRDGLGARGVAIRIDAVTTCPGSSGAVVCGAFLGDFRRPHWRKRLATML